MLRWKPANIKDAVLQMQSAIAMYRGEVDWKQCHYYITDDDIATALGKAIDGLKNSDVNAVLCGLGLRLDKEVYELRLPSIGMTGYFVPENALKRVGISLPEWNLPPRRRGRPRRFAQPSRTQPARFPGRPRDGAGRFAPGKLVF
jgi:hypothetical protein